MFSEYLPWNMLADLLPYFALALSVLVLVRQEVLIRRDKKRRLRERQEKLIARYGFERVQEWSK